MRFFYGKQDMPTLQRAQERLMLLTNGLGGYASVTAAYSVNRCDQGILVAAVKAPNERITLVHRMRESLTMGGRSWNLSSQAFTGKIKAEDGFRNLSGFVYDYVPQWTYQMAGVTVRRTLAMAQGSNASALLYEIENQGTESCTLELEPFLKLAPKESALTEKKRLSFRKNCISDGSFSLYIHTDGTLERIPAVWQLLAYPEDAKEGRNAKGLSVCCCRVTKTLEPGQKEKLEIVFSDQKTAPSAEDIRDSQIRRLQELETAAGFFDPLARQLAVAADAYIARRDSTDGKTILAGYPLFSDWGRDTMIALPGCCLATSRFDDARSILKTFLAYEKDGLVPNLFPEGETQPMYNTVDAALLLIDSVWQYIQRTQDYGFLREAWPVMEHIIACYRRGTQHSIAMDTDGLIRAGGGLDQVTWMDVCVNYLAYPALLVLATAMGLLL